MVQFLYDVYDSEQQNEYLEKLGLESASSIINLTWLVLFYLLIILLHLSLTIIHYNTKSKTNEIDVSCLTRSIRRLFHMFTYNIYVRIMIGSNLFILLNSTSETYEAKLDTKTASYVFALVAFMTSIGLLGLTISQSIKSWNPEKFIKLKYFKELFRDLKPSRAARSYNAIELIRFLILVLLLIYLKTLIVETKAALYAAIQLTFLIVHTVIRPFKHKRHNFIKIVNEIIYFLLCWYLNYFNKLGRWNSISENIFIYSIVSNSIAMLCIALCKFNYLIIDVYSRTICMYKAMLYES